MRASPIAPVTPPGRHRSRHATAWAVAAFFAAGLTVPVYFIRYRAVLTADAMARLLPHADGMPWKDRKGRALIVRVTDARRLTGHTVKELNAFSEVQRLTIEKPGEGRHEAFLVPRDLCTVDSGAPKTPS